ncbi:MAG: ABC transporter permease [Acidimicrobiales bacterium]|jgi:spermidine/putrescine transport system permease protein|nr:spermidine/putrescine ABC transporter permease PotC [Acidimicrobiaceae bacterium]MDP6976445.1 ABC transporter permease [Acidimicrobiales bacterium]
MAKGVARSTAEPMGWSKWLLRGHSALVYAFFYAPIAVLTFYSFNESQVVGRWTGFSMRWYGDFLENDNVQQSIWVSVKVCIASTLISVVLGTLAALSIERFRWWGQKAFDAVLYLPIIIPDVTMAVMLMVFFSETAEWFNVIPGVDLSEGLEKLVLSHVAFNISFVSVVVRARLTNLDATMEEAAADLYANRWQTFRRVTLPQIMPGVLGGALLAVTLSLDDVVVSSFVSAVGATPVSVYVFGMLRKGVSPLINAVSVVILAASMALVIASLVLERVTNSPKGPEEE